MYVSESIHIPVRLIYKGSIVTTVLKCTPTLADMLALGDVDTIEATDLLYTFFRGHTIDGYVLLRSDFDTIEEKANAVDAFLEEMKKKTMSAVEYLKRIQPLPMTVAGGN